MQKVLERFDITNIPNFWKVNNFFLTDPIFKEYYISDRSKGKKNSHIIMWGIAHIVEKEFNVWWRTPLEERKEIIFEEVMKTTLGKKEFNWDKADIVKVIDHWEKLNKSPFQRQLDILENKLFERGEILKEQQYSLENFAALDKLISNSNTIEERVTKLREVVEKEINNEAEIHGGRRESGLEKLRQ